MRLFEASPSTHLTWLAIWFKASSTIALPCSQSIPSFQIELGWELKLTLMGIPQDLG